MSCLVTGAHDAYTKLFSDIITNKNSKIKLLYYNDIIHKIKKNILKRNKIIFILNDENDNKKKISDFLFKLKEKNYKVHILYVDINQLFNQDKHFIFQLNEVLQTQFKISDFDTLKNIEISKMESNKHNCVQVLPKLHTSVVICGICKDIQKYFNNASNIFLFLTHYFTHSTIIIYENDSKDNTLSLLKKFKSTYDHKNIIILSEKNINGSRTEKIAHARNKILDYVDNHNINPDYLINLDMDDILTDFKCSTILEPFKSTLNWSMFGGNSKIYYDMWALRPMDFPYFDFWKLEDISREERLKYYFKIPIDSMPIKVFSCFNGIGIYKYKDTIGCRYNGKDTCEHVSFHNEMIKKHKANLYIHPKLMVGPHKILSKPMHEELNNVTRILKDGFFKS